MRWGFACGNGWYPILWELFTAIERELGPEPGDFLVVQVKEKFGRLRVYVEPSCPAVEELIRAAKEKARRTCERCGQPGVLREDRSWWRTLCEGCAARTRERE